MKRPQDELHRRLRARRVEIEAAAAARVEAVAPLGGDAEPEYLAGMRVAVSEAVGFALGAVEHGEGLSRPIPAQLLFQARLAARNAVPLETVIRRYFAGYSLIGDLLVEEAERGGFEPAALKPLLRRLTSLFDRLLATVSSEYERERSRRGAAPQARRIELVRRLLAGERLDATELAYELDGHHLGLVASGPDPAGALRGLAKSLDRRLLLVPRDETTAWAWLGGRRPVDPDLLRRRLDEGWPQRLCLAVGEPGRGRTGWRLSHRQALAALPIALRSGSPLTRYGDVAILSAICQDDLLSTSLRNLCLAPLGAERDGGRSAVATLRAYFAAGRNATSAAAALGVNRHTVTARLRSIEERIGRPLESCALELEAALRLDEFEHSPPRFG